VRRRHRKRRSTPRLTTFQAGAIGIVLIILFSYGCYTKFANPFASQFTIHAEFANANGLVPNAPVRIAGVNVGKVTGVSAVGGSSSDDSGKQAALVTMEINSNGLPIHTNATFDIRPRIFLEGNFFVDLHPGTPEAPTIGTGHTFPISAGTEPVQLDQVLTSLPLDTRENLQTLVEQYGKAVYLSGPSYDASIKYWLPAYKYSGEVAHDFLGTRPHDLSTFINEGGTVSGALDAHPENLENLISYFDTTADSFARESTALQAAVAELPKTLSAAIPAFNALNSAFPPLEELATTLLPGVRSSGPTIDASLPFVNQLRLLVQPNELRGLAGDLAVTIPALAHLTQSTIPLMKNGVRPVSSCVVNIIYPWSQLSINDGHFSGTQGFPVRKVFQEGVDYLPGLAGESRNFDANGPYIRVLLTGGSLTYSLQPGLFGQALAPIDSVQPVVPATRPPLHPNTPCETQAPITTLDTPSGPPITQLNTSLDAPGASLRWLSAVNAAIGELKQMSSWNGVKVDLTSTLEKALKLP
jgi:phospholipid/cholesterol/gamma-HCH transport system substrate-binding protein